MPTRADMQRIVDDARRLQGDRLYVWCEKNGWTPIYVSSPSRFMKYSKLYHNGKTVAFLTVFGALSKEYGGDWYIRSYCSRKSKEITAHGFGVIQLEEAIKCL